MLKLLLFIFSISIFADTNITSPVFRPPVWAEANRPDCSAKNSCLGFNSNTNSFDFSIGADWKKFPFVDFISDDEITLEASYPAAANNNKLAFTSIKGIFYKSDGAVWQSLGDEELLVWTTPKNYILGDLMFNTENRLFRALSTHAAGATLDADRLAGRWQEMAPTVFRPYVVGQQYFVGEFIKTSRYSVYTVEKNFVAAVSTLNDLFLGNIDFFSPSDITTSYFSGGIVTRNGATYDVTAGNGIIVRNNNTVLPSYDLKVTWAGVNGLVLPNPEGWSTIQVDSAGLVSIVPGVAQPDTYASAVVLATIRGATGDVYQLKGAALDHGNTIRDALLTYGLSKSGILFNGNADKTFLTSSGSLLFPGISPDTESSSLKTCPPQGITNFHLFDQDTYIGERTILDTANFDVGGVLTALTGTQWTYFKIFITPDCDISLQYGQDVESSKAEIVTTEEINTQQYVLHPALLGQAKYIGILFFQNGIVELNNTATSYFKNSGPFGIGSAGSGGAAVAGDVLGPANSTDNAIARFDGLNGKVIQNSGVTISDTSDIILPGYIDFNEAMASPVHGAGRLFYNSTSDSLAFYNSSIGITVNVGQSIIFKVRNNSGAVITKGKVVRITGAVGQRPSIALAQANTITNSQGVGVTAQDIANNADGYINTFGAVTNIDTSAFLEGDTVYLSATVAGGLTTTAPAIATRVGRILNAHNAQGSLGVNPSSTAGSNLLVTGANTNTPSSTAPTSAVTFMTGRTSAGALNPNQTTTDIAIESGAGGFKHFISTQHNNVASSGLNAINFYLNNSVAANGSTTPATGNVLGARITPIGTGILLPLTEVPYAPLDVVGNIYASIHGNASMHNAAEIGTRSIGMKSGNTADGFTGIKLNVKATDSAGTAVVNNSDIQFWTWGNGISVSREVARITERGRLGIGTTNPTKTLSVIGNQFLSNLADPGTLVGPSGGLQVYGTASSVNGPHTQWTTNADIYPTRQFHNWAHNQIGDCFDCYWDGANWRNSNASSSFRWYKNATDLTLSTVAVPTAGGTEAQVDKLAINETGNMTLQGQAIPVLQITGNTDNQVSGTLFLSQGNANGFKLAYDATNTNDGLRITERRADVETVRMNFLNGGKVQIGGALPNTTNVGVARIEVNGDNGAATGPHMSFNNDSDNFPIRHFLNWSHDNIWDCFDCYYDGAALRNSNASSAFRWTKTATDLILDSVAVPTAGGNEAHTNRLSINENGNVSISEDLYVSGYKIDGPAIARVVNEESLAFNQVAFQSACGWGGAGGAGANPLVPAAGINGLNVSDGCWSSPAFLPAVAAAGTVFYYLRQSGLGFNIATDRTDQAAQVGINGGWVASFRSDGATWIYQGQAPWTGRMLIGSTTQTGMGANGQVLTTNGAGALSWSDVNARTSVFKQAAITGGGALTSNAMNVSWSSRFIIISAEKNASVPSGYFDINMPPNGTVITGLGRANVNVAGGRIQMAAWDALWYKLPIGANNATNNANFYISNYNGANFTPTSEYVLIAQHNPESNIIRWVNGTTTTTGQNDVSYDWRGNSPWVAIPSTNAAIRSTGVQVRYEQFGTIARFKGNITPTNDADGGMGPANTFGLMPVGYRPAVQVFYNNGELAHTFRMSTSSFNVIRVPANGFVNSETGVISFTDMSGFETYWDTTWSL